ncbi:MAG TPA: hypothetical protein PKA66_05990 [Gemmatimonadales bacterium]|nr:hypothetical protein [Gemmatimonadales bacterium]
MVPTPATRFRFRVALYGGAVALVALYIALPPVQWRVALSASVLYFALCMVWARLFFRYRGHAAWRRAVRPSRAVAGGVVFAALALLAIWLFRARGATIVAYLFPAAFLIALLVDTVALRFHLRVQRTEEEVADFLQAVADGGAGRLAWELFVFDPIDDPRLEAIRIQLLLAERRGTPRPEAAAAALATLAEGKGTYRVGWPDTVASSLREQAVAVILAMLMFVGSGTSSAATAITATLVLLLGLLVGSFKALDAWYHRRNLRALREMHPERHAEIIRAFPHPGYRARLERDLARDLASYIPGVADAFGFADSLKREATIQYWLAASVVAAFFVGTQRLALPAWWNAGILLVEGVGGLAGLHFLMRWRRYLDTWLEVSRFGIAEIWPDGARRQIPWHQQLWLQNQPRRRRVRVLIGNRSAWIPIHYRRTNFARAMDLVVEYGGFRPDPPPQAAAGEGGA